MPPKHLCHRDSPLGPISVADLTGVPMAVIHGHGSPAHLRLHFKKVQSVATLALAPLQISGSAFGSDVWQRGGNKDGGRIIKTRLRNDNAAATEPRCSSFSPRPTSPASVKSNNRRIMTNLVKTGKLGVKLEPERHSTRLD